LEPWIIAGGVVGGNVGLGTAVAQSLHLLVIPAQAGIQGLGGGFWPHDSHRTLEKPINTETPGCRRDVGTEALDPGVRRDDEL